ncbi:hypothetical protein M406DRAFT_99225 [Cryphonectria parasitica EP155]|uniref:Dihydroxy-acid dehydratase n=1 Tax=Cryphonectria parasitica (strain ATCC 38755 / EP155) TaxID=660469 RepID=A0A9P4XT53_CRYP1|nr:uncharacterized protein M406DRAFT_99225 [Cryphonectria parasitica EP155]KAF3760453.1 hypothetical protein M406DRAFT_99225 [Cryphonectria parasitica EP155]
MLNHSSFYASSSVPDHLADYDLSRPIQPIRGMRQGLPNYGDPHFALFLRKAFIKALGYSEDALSRPIVGIVNTYSAFNPCHANVPQLIEAAKRGVQLGGGLAMEFPTISIHESFSSPTSMFLRNLMSMDTEEMIRAQPVDACIVIGGCDKTVPAQIMGGISSGKPVLPLITGPMMPGSFRGQRIGACTDCRNNWAAYRGDELDVEDISELNAELAPTAGSCGVMGTASTMACLVAALGLMDLRAGATAPAVSSARLRVAEDTGKNAVLAAQSLTNSTDSPLSLATVLSEASFHNAVTVLQAIGGSTNGIVHLLAIANRHPGVAGKVTLQTIDDIGRRTPLLVDLKPSGDNYMTDLHNAGGMLALLHTLRPLLRLEAMTLTGQTMGQVLDATPFRTFPFSRAIIRPLDDPVYESSSLLVLRGNLAPHGAVMKASASKYRHLLSHRGRAVVFAGPADLAARIDDPDLAVDKDSVLVLQGIGPIGFLNPGMPEAGLVPIPRKLAVQGVQDMLRLSDGRMSGTAGGSVILHISPEAALPESVLGVVRNRDVIVCDVDKRLLEVELSADEIARRIAERRERLDGTKESRGPSERRRKPVRGYRGLYERHVNQAEDGVDFDFLTAAGAEHSSF